jgi:hypothetical protein
MNGIPKTLDHAFITTLNGIIVCRGRSVAVEEFRSSCIKLGKAPKAWAIRYIELYLKFTKPTETEYINVRAAQKALDQVNREYQ